MDGFSGNKLEVQTVQLINGSMVRIVHKELVRATDESRSKLQVEINKTEAMGDRADRSVFQVPRVIDRGIDWYDREFIIGETLEDYLEHKGTSEWRQWHQRIRRMMAICSAINSSYCDPVAFTRYLDKLWRGAVKTVDPCRRLETYGSLWPLIQQASYPIPPAGFCHGDLALDNIIVDPEGQMWLIDPLLNVYETPWWDVGKLLQSTRAHWRFLREGHLVQPPSYLNDWTDELLKEDRHMALFFALVVLLRIIRHAPTQGQKRALLTRVNSTAMAYLKTLGLVV